MNAFDKAMKFAASRPQRGGGSARGVFHTFKTGDNIVRLVGNFIEVKTHFIAPVKARGDKGLCIQDAFEGEDKLPQVVNCPDWDVENEKPRSAKQCPICALYNAYKEASRKPGLSEAEKKHLDEMAGKCAPRTALKWNLIDRDDPWIVEVTDKGEKKVLGYKIATIGMEAWNDINGIFTQCGFDIAGIDSGIDINVCRTEAKKTSYSARAVLAGLSVKTTPLTEDEKAMQLHDLRRLCGKQTDPNAIRDALHSELLEKLLGSDSGEGSDVEEEEVEAPKSAPKASAASTVSASKTASFSSTKKTAAAPVKEEEPEEAPFDAEDDADAKEEKPSKVASDDGEDDGEKEEAKDDDASSWQCFGTIDVDHPECKSCESRVACAKKAGVELPVEKKGRGTK